MGITRLTWLLRQYAEPKSLEAQEVVIDGPALCYHIYYLCLSTRKTARNSLEAGISYRELGLVTIAWLDQLRASRVKV